MWQRAEKGWPAGKTLRRARSTSMPEPNGRCGAEQSEKSRHLRPWRSPASIAAPTVADFAPLRQSVAVRWHIVDGVGRKLVLYAKVALDRLAKRQLNLRGLRRNGVVSHGSQLRLTGWDGAGLSGGAALPFACGGGCRAWRYRARASRLGGRWQSHAGLAAG